MELERLIEIMADDNSPVDGTSVMFGLNMMIKYVPSFDVGGVGHDIIYGESVDKMLEAGLTECDAVLLRQQNWFIEEDYFASFV
jgi:hypothetical protein